MDWECEALRGRGEWLRRVEGADQQGGNNHTYGRENLTRDRQKLCDDKWSDDMLCDDKLWDDKLCDDKLYVSKFMCMTGKRREVDYGRRDTEPSKWCL